MTAVSWRHQSVLRLAGRNVSLRCPRVHFHSACSCAAPSLTKPLLAVVPGRAGLGRDTTPSTYTQLEDVLGLLGQEVKLGGFVEQTAGKAGASPGFSQ